MLDKSFMFGNKPAMHLRFDDVEHVDIEAVWPQQLCKAQQRLAFAKGLAAAAAANGLGQLPYEVLRLVFEAPPLNHMVWDLTVALNSGATHIRSPALEVHITFFGCISEDGKTCPIPPGATGATGAVSDQG